MNCIEHAKEEFKYAGYKPIDQSEDDPDKWIQENVLELLEVFEKQGHSGFSAPFAIKYFSKLANFEPLTPITCKDEEWSDMADGQSNPDELVTYQNKRLSAIFKEGKEGRPYFLDAIVWKDEKGATWTGVAYRKDGSEIASRQYIKLPYMKKVFYIDVISKEIAPDDWEFYVKDEAQLDEVFQYYEFMEVKKRKPSVSNEEGVPGEVPTEDIPDGQC